MNQVPEGISPRKVGDAVDLVHAQCIGPVWPCRDHARRPSSSRDRIIVIFFHVIAFWLPFKGRTRGRYARGLNLNFTIRRRLHHRNQVYAGQIEFFAHPQKNVAISNTVACVDRGSW